MTRFWLVTAASCLVVCLLLLQLPAPAVAQAQSGIVSGTVVDSAAKPVSGAEVDLAGPVQLRTATAGDGTFAFQSVQPGLYSLTVTKSGFVNAQQADITVTPAQTSTVQIALQPTSFESLQTIGSATSAGRNAINVSPVSVAVINNATFADQGQNLVSKILNETPGIVASFSGAQQDGEMNGAVPGTYFAPQVRGGLPYETASLIDGHPIAVAFVGTYNAAFLDTHLLQSIEVAKGPGATPPNINYAVNGTVNYHTLEPTLKPVESVEFGFDKWGGEQSNYRATGTLFGKLGYAFDYAVNGTPGILRNYPFTATIIPAYPSGNPVNNGQINGQPVCFAFQCSNSTTVPVNGTNVFDNYNIDTPIIGTGFPINTNYLMDNELGKLRYNFSQQTALTVSYIGIEGNYNQEGSQAYTESNVIFTPPAGYTGSIPAGSTITCCGQIFPSIVQINQGFYQAEFRTSFANSSFSARYYGANVKSITNGSGTGQNPGTPYPMTLYGGIDLGTSTTPTIYNGVPATVFDPYGGSVVNIYDKLGGTTLEYDVTSGNNTFSLSYDDSADNSFARVSFNLALSNTPPPVWYTVAFVPQGSEQTFRTWLGKANLVLSPKTTLTLADYMLDYDDHYSSDGGATFQDSTHAFNAPRASLVFQPNSDVSFRASLGASIAPPYIRLISASAFPPTPDNYAAPNFFTESLSAGALKPETAFGYDLGVDARVGDLGGKPVLASGDLYLSNLQNQFFPTTTLVTSSYSSSLYPTPTPVPLYASTTSNLGFARYEGLEFSFKQTPAAGFGWLAQGALMRAYAYDIPPSLYATSAGPLTANLAVLPNINFNGSASTTLYNGSWNGVGQGRTPYGQGYLEANYRTVKGLYGNVGATYYGNNNSYNWPAFWTLSANLRIPLWKGGSLSVSGDNLSNQHATTLPCISCGIPVPLANGQVGNSVGVNLGPPFFQFVFKQEF